MINLFNKRVKMKIEGQGKSSYLVLIEPEKKVSFRVEKLKDMMRSEFNMITNPFFNPHITVIDFEQYETYEKVIINRLTSYAQELNPFLLKLSDFGTFGHTFFIRALPEGEDLNKLVARKAEMKGIFRTSIKTQNTYHLTIFKELTKEQSQDIWDKWQTKSFEDQFMVHELVLLRKKNGHRHYQELARLPLIGKEPKPSYVQGTLFDL